MRKRKTIAFLFFLCLLPRLLLFVYAQPWKEDVVHRAILGLPDALGYHHLAHILIEQQRFGDQEYGLHETIRTPGYPLFIGIFYKLFGQRVWIVLLVQILINAFTCVLLFLLLDACLSGRAALVASVFFALDPHMILFSNQLLSEILFVFFCVAGFKYLLNGFREVEQGGGTVPLGISGFLFGIATLVRPQTTYLPFLVLVIALLWTGGRMRQALKCALIFSLFFLLALSPWILRNHARYDALSLSSSSAHGLLVLFAAPIEMEVSNKPFGTAQHDLLDEADRLMRQDGLDPKTTNGFVQAEYWKRVALPRIQSHPGVFLKYFGIGVVNFFGTLGTSQYSNMLDLSAGSKSFSLRRVTSVREIARQWLQEKSLGEKLLAVFIASFLAGSYGCLLVGLIKGWTTQPWRVLAACLLFAAYFVAISGPAGKVRFRLPAIPFYLVFVGIGFDWILSAVKGRFRKQDPDRFGRTE